MTSSAPSLASEQPAAMSQPARIINTFIAPVKTFGDFRRGTSWWMAWLLLVAVSYGFVYTMDQKIGMDQITQTEIARNSRATEQMDRLPADRRAEAMERATRITRGISYAVPVFGLVIYLLVAAVLAGTFNFGLGAQVPFKVALAITIYGFLPSAIGAVLGSLAILLGMNPEGFNPRNPVFSNPAFFMDATAHKFLYGVASALDIFSLWTVVLIGVGFACNSKVKRSTAITVVLAWFLIVKLIGAAWAALS